MAIYKIKCYECIYVKWYTYLNKLLNLMKGYFKKQSPHSKREQMVKNHHGDFGT